MCATVCRLDAHRIMKRLLLAPVVLFVAACSAADHSSPSEISLASVKSSNVCGTLDYGHTKTPAEFYRKFDTDDAAGAYLAALVSQGKLASQTGPGASFKEITQDPRLVGLVAEVFSGFQKVFPKETDGLVAPPRVAIVNSDVPNAYALGPGFAETAEAPQDQAPWIFIVHTGLLAAPREDNELRGLFAHEMGHLVLRTFLPEIRQRLRAMYAIGKSEDGILGAAQHDDPTVAEHTERIIERQARVSGLPSLGFTLFENLGYYAKAIFTLIRARQAESDHPEQVCVEARTAINRLITAETALLPGKDQGNLVPATPTSDQQSELDRLASNAMAEIHNCLVRDVASPEQGSLMVLAAAMNHIDAAAENPNHPDHAKLEALTLDIEKSIDQSEPELPLVDRILLADGQIRSELLELIDDPGTPIDRIRIFDYEEDADDASVRVVAALGYDPTAVGKFVLSMAPQADRDECFRRVDIHEPIDYGRFIDTHPAMCWRYYHAKQFSESLARCSSVPVARSLLRSSGRPSVLDRVSSLSRLGFRSAL